MKAIIFGGGKIARGFIAHLLYLSNVSIVFIEINDTLVQLMRQRPSYRVNIMGIPERNCDITGYKAFNLTDIDQIANEWLDADVAFNCVGGKNLPSLGEVIAAAFQLRSDKAAWTRPFNIITCENWKEPAKVLQQAIQSNLSDSYSALFDRWVGVSEAVVMRSAVEPTEGMLERDPLCVCVQDFWDLPVDSEPIKGNPPVIEGIRYIDHFSGFLERKFYTYNAANGTVSYLGYLRKHRYINEAAADPAIVEILETVYLETSTALAMKYRVTLNSQLDFAKSSKRKLQDRNIIDYVERNARDPIRKLGPFDRLVGSAWLVMQYGLTPHGLATAIAAAIHYDQPGDPFAEELTKIRQLRGIDNVLIDICKMLPGEPLALLVKDKINWLIKEGWIK